MFHRGDFWTVLFIAKCHLPRCVLFKRQRTFTWMADKTYKLGKKWNTYIVSSEHVYTWNARDGKQK